MFSDAENAVYATVASWRWRDIAIVAAITAVAAAVFGAAITWYLVPSVVTSMAGGLMTGLFLGLLVFTSAIALRQFSHQQNALLQINALVNIRPLLGSWPAPFDEWSSDALYLQEVARVIATKRPHLIVECGSGISTVLAARCLAQLGGGRRLVSIDHDDAFADQTRRRIALEGLSGIADVVTMPLREQDVNGKRMRWYDFSSFPLRESRIDLLLVDGPPGTDATGKVYPGARYPALHVLRPHLAGDAIVLLDDGNRKDERETAARWARESGVPLHTSCAGKGHHRIELGTH